MLDSVRCLFNAAAGIAIVCAALAAAVLYIATKLFVKTALDRKQPEIMKKLNKKISGAGKAKEDAAFKETYNEASQKLKSTAHETVEITADDGTKLVGHFFPCDKAQRIIIAFHGWRSCWNYDFGVISEFWHTNNCCVLYAEQRGQNESGGQYIGLGLTERYDCVDWINWAICRCGKNIPVYLAGVSMGAATVLMAAGLQLPDNVHGIMADSAFTSPENIFRHIAQNNLHISYALHKPFINKMCRKRINVGFDDYSTVEALKNTNIPVLFIHGDDDRFVPLKMTYENYDACKAPKKLLVVPGADHVMSYYIDKSEYEKAVKEFWKKFD